MMPTWHLTSLWVHGVWHMSFEPSWCPHNDVLCQKFWKFPFLEQSSLKGLFFTIFQNPFFVIAPLFLILNERRFMHCVPRKILKILDEKTIEKSPNLWGRRHICKIPHFEILAPCNAYTENVKAFIYSMSKINIS